MSKADETAARLSESTPRVAPIPDADFLSTGSTLLNLAFSGRADVGIAKGHYVYYVGDSSSGKTWLGFSLFAEANRNKSFAKHRFIFDNVENGALMDVERYFGKGVLERLEPPRTTGKGRDKQPAYSVTAQDFYMNLEGNCKKGPCIYLLDSMDALNDEADEEKFAAELHYHETGKGASNIPGSMGMNKAKTNSKYINREVAALRDSGSILVILSQTRDNIGGYGKRRSGGHALKFYAHVEAWTSVKDPITRTYLKKEREIGSDIKIDIRKNRISGWEGKIYLPFLKGFGFDDIGSCVDYLIDERHWEKSGTILSDNEDEDTGGTRTKFAAPEFDTVGNREQIIKRIQDGGDERELQLLVSRVWREIIAKAAPPRKPRYM